MSRTKRSSVRRVQVHRNEQTSGSAAAGNREHGGLLPSYQLSTHQYARSPPFPAMAESAKVEFPKIPVLKKFVTLAPQLRLRVRKCPKMSERRKSSQLRRLKSNCAASCLCFERCIDDRAYPADVFLRGFAIRGLGDDAHDRLGVARPGVHPGAGPSRCGCRPACRSFRVANSFFNASTARLASSRRHSNFVLTISYRGISATSCADRLAGGGHERQDVRHADQAVAAGDDARIDHAAVAFAADDGVVL